MARAAVLRGRNVPGWFANRLDSVVTGGTSLGRRLVVELLDRPLTGRVAGVARGLGDNMPRRHAAGAHRIVATRAVLGRSLESSVLVAALAAHVGMRAGERKAGFEVIEAGTWCRLGNDKRRGGEKHRRNQQKHRQKTLPDHLAPPSRQTCKLSTGCEQPRAGPTT